MWGSQHYPENNAHYGGGYAYPSYGYGHPPGAQNYNHSGAQDYHHPGAQVYNQSGGQYYQGPDRGGYGNGNYGEAFCSADPPHAEEDRRERRRDREDSRKGGGKGHEGKSEPRKGGKGSERSGRQPEGGSRDLVRSRSRSRHSPSRSSSASSKPKRRSRKAAGFDCVTKPRESGKVPVEATPQRGLKLAPGRKADVQGLKGASQYNGCEGIVIEGPNDKGRWEVQVDYQCETKTLSLLESNLQPKPSCGWELVVAPIGLGIKETDVSQALTPHGRVRHVKMTDPPGVCLVEMALKEGAEAAFSHLRHFELKGTQVSLDWSTMAKTEMGMCNKRKEKSKDPEPTRSFKERPTEESLGFRLQQVVLISNLKGAPQFNGQRACVVGFRSDRVEVEIEADGAKKTLALKPENLSDASEDAPAAEAPPAQAPEHEEKPVEATRKRRPKWEENSGGFVVVPPTEGCAKTASGPFPSIAELEQMSMKELKQVLKEHAVDTTGCLEKAEFQQKAMERAKERQGDQ